MRAAPPVSYPMGRPRWRRALLSLLMLLHLTVMGAVVALQPDAHLALIMGLLLLPAWILTLRIEPTAGAQLQWDGTCWHLMDSAHPVSGQLQLVMDLQRVLLLRWVPPFFSAAPRSTWLWVEENADPVIWRDVRRAVYWNAH